MRIISWNINGIRAVIRKGFKDFLEQEKNSIIALQEIKIHDEARAKENFDFFDWAEYWNGADRPGYSGTAVLVPNKKNKLVLNAWTGMGEHKFDTEGRVQTLEFKKFYLINAYFPNANHELSRLNYKLEFNDYLLKYLKKLEKKKPIIICGDFNVAHQEIDLARPKENIGNAGFTYEEREWADKFIKNGFIDTFRYFYPNEQKYSWWSYRTRARARNIGWRIDYFFVSVNFIKNVKNAFILNEVLGSDHCPIGIEIKN